MASDELDKVELPALEQLQSLGWSIRDHLGDADQSVITQFERWWDKYRVSLHKIDVQVIESEEVMWGYLKELGCE